MGRTALLACPEGGTSLSAMAGLDRSSFNTEPGLRSISFSLLCFCAVCCCRQLFCCSNVDSPSQALPRQLPQRGSQAVKFIAKALDTMKSFPAVLLPLPLRKDFPRPGEDVAQRQKGECGCERSEQTERASPLSFFAAKRTVARYFAQRFFFR